MEWLDWNSFEHPIDEGMKFYASLGRRITHHFVPELFEKLDFDDDNCFLEPSLFACFHQDNPAEFIPSVLAAKVLNKENRFHCHAFSNISGQLIFPALGMVGDFTPHSWHSITLEKDTAGDKVIFCGDSEHSAYPLNPTNYDSSLLLPCRHSLFDGLYWNREAQRCPPEKAALCTHDILTTFDDACQILEACNKNLHSAIIRCCSGVLVTHAANINSFASETAQGIAFLNFETMEEASLPFFIEEMAHQCGHVIFSFLTADRSHFFETDPHRKIKDFTGNSWDERDIYTIFHGVFTELAICETLFTAHEQISTFPDLDQSELSGRLGYIVQRMRLDGSYLKAINGLTQSGRDLQTYLLACVDEVLKILYPLVKDMDFSNQPYNFYLATFLQQNKTQREFEWVSI